MVLRNVSTREREVEEGRGRWRREEEGGEGERKVEEGRGRWRRGEERGRWRREVGGGGREVEREGGWRGEEAMCSTVS